MTSAVDLDNGAEGDRRCTVGLPTASTYRLSMNWLTRSCSMPEGERIAITHSRALEDF
jgi:hypothetical protein